MKDSYIKAAVWGICFAKPCGTLGKQQRIKLSSGKLANSSKHSVLLSVGSKYGGEGLPWLLDEGLSPWENFTFPWQARITWLASSSFPVPCNILKCRSFCPNYRGKSLLEKCPLLIIQSTPRNSNPLYNSIIPLTRGNFHFPSGQFSIQFYPRQLELPITRTFSIFLEGWNYRESTVESKKRLTWEIL